MAVFFLGGGHFVGRGPFVSVRDPTDTANSDPKKSKNMSKNLFFAAVPTVLFSYKTERAWPLVPSIGAVRTEKT